VLSFGNKKMNANNLRANITIKIMHRPPVVDERRIGGKKSGG
jgi:hypothetical protein